MLYVNGLLDNGISARGIASGVVDMGGTLDPDVVLRHKAKHWVAKERTEGPLPTKRDLATLVRDKTYEAVKDLSGEALLFMGKDLGPMVGKGLQAEAIIDKRAVNDAKLGLAAGALSLQAWLSGLGAGTAPPKELDDGNIIEGDYEEVP